MLSRVKSQSKALVICALIAGALLVVLHGNIVAGAGYGGNGNQGTCVEATESMTFYKDNDSACSKSGIGWMYYAFDSAFIEGILINKTTGKIFRDASGYPYTEVSKPDYDTNTYRVLETGDILMGPGLDCGPNCGNGDWLALSNVVRPGQNADICRSSQGDGIFREGYFEAKTFTVLFSGLAPGQTQFPHTAINNLNGAGPTVGTHDSTTYKVGITGKVYFYKYESEQEGRQYKNLTIDSPVFGAAGQGVVEFINSKSNLEVGQNIYYDDYVIMTTTDAYNIESKEVLKAYIDYIITYLKRVAHIPEDATSEEIEKVYKALTLNAAGEEYPGAGANTVKILLDKNQINRNKVTYGLSDSYLRDAVDDAYQNFNVSIAGFCYASKSDTTYSADTIIGTADDRNAYHTDANRYSENDKKIVLNGNPDSYSLTAGYYDNITINGKTNQALEYGIRLYDWDNNRAPISGHGEVHKSDQFKAISGDTPKVTTTINFGNYKNIQVCSYVKYKATFLMSDDDFSNPQEKESCVILSKEIHSSILWSKIDLFARVGANSGYTVSADGNASCNTLWANFDPASTNVARTTNADGLRISAAEAPAVNGSGRYSWNSASNSGRCHIQAQRGKLPTRIVMRVSAARKAGVHEGDGADVLAGSDFSVNIGNGSGSDFSKNLSSMMDGGFTYTWNTTDGARKPHLAFSGESTNFVKLNDVDKSVYQVFPEQEIAANDTYTHPKIAKDLGNTNEASYRLEGQSNILTSSSSVNFSVVRDGFRCPDRFKNDSAYYYGIYNGRNLASVDFEISDGVNTRSGAGGNAYAKPGQMVRFVYNMCAGGTYTHMARTSASGSIENSLGATWTDSANTHFTLKVEDTTGDGKDYSAGYLFGKIPFGYNNQDTTATFSTQGNSQNISSNVNFLKISNNQDQDTGVKFNADITQYSLRTPSGQNSEAAGKYSCNYGDVSGPYYYYIGDGLGGICSKNGSDSIARRKEGWDLGRRFKESVTYTHLVYANGQKTDGPYDVTTDATINTPFNYKTNPSADISSIDNSYITAGDSLSVTANFNLEPITNDALTFFNNEAEKTYTTRSKSSLLVSFGFIVPAEGNNKSDLVNYYSSSKYVDNPDTGMTLDRLCEAAFPNNRYCASTTGEDEFGRRETLSLDGAAVDRSKTYILSENGSDVTEDGEKAYSWAFNGRKYEVPGEYSGRVGDVVCVVSAIYPANSYNLGINENSISANDSRLSNALSGEGAGDGAKWALSKPSCTTISKKPTFSVEGGSLFVAGNINTYNGIYRHKNEYVNDTYMYGSWSEYGITLGGLNRSMASGAGYGYGSTGGVTVGGSNTILRPNEGGKAYYRLSHVNDECALSSQTVSNAKCSEGGGNFGEGVSSEVIDKIKGQLDNTLSDLKARYKNNTLVSSTGALATSLSNGQAIADDDICYYDAAASEYRTKSGALGFCSSKGEQYFDISGSQFVIGNNLNFKFTDRDDMNANQRNRTIIIRINGTLMIDGDITIEDDGYSSIKQIPNVLIFAKNVEISDRVNRIDAWIIADNLFNTCAFKSSDYSFKYTKEDQLHAADCDNPLIINGPVSANKIRLFRTAGAGTNPNETDPNSRLEFDRNYYVVRAEVFNMTPATYLWARAQAESNSGLITTYVKELPVRY